jgi:hypothetical protein
MFESVSGTADAIFSGYERKKLSPDEGHPYGKDVCGCRKTNRAQGDGIDFQPE